MSAGCRAPALVVGRVYRKALKAAKPCALTETQQVELVAWYKAKCALGTFKTKAIELGVRTSTLHCIVERRLGLRRGD